LSGGTPTALQGLRVLDLSRVLAGPWSTQLLADLGAEVVKVEKPGAGDDTRQWGPPYVTSPDGASSEAAYFLCTNRGKRSICVDMARPEGQEIIRELAAQSDVLVENFKVGALARYGLDYASLSSLNPRLVYCSITGFGQDGPYAGRAGYDFMIQGMSGLMSVTGEADGAPMKVGVALVDIITGLYASNAILAALRHRDSTGRGQHLDVALLDSMVAALANQTLNYLASGRNPRRFGNAHPNIVPYETFTAADGTFIVAVGNDAQFRKLCAIVGDPDLAQDGSFSNNEQRVTNRIALIARLDARLSTRPAAEWLRRLDAAGIPAGPINTLEQVFADPQVRSRGLRVDLPDARLGSVPGVACPIRLSDTPIRYERPPPALGEGTRDVLRHRLNLTDEAIGELERHGIVACGDAVPPSHQPGCR
jgi:crotonobetainyl-CoA:carnitine CoA-transferase CaiB-like acyl-CoA transferase